MSQDNRTLQPTAQRRRQARLDGNVAVSGQLTAAVVWLAVTVAACFAGQHGLASMKMIFKQVWAAPYSASAEGLLAEASVAAWMILPVLAIVTAAALAGRIAQVGSIWAPQRVLPNATRVHPSDRLVDLLSPGKLHQVMFATGLAVGGFAFVGWGIWSQRRELIRLITVPDLETELLQRLSTWGLRLGVFLVVFAIVDYAYQRYRFEMSLRMSPEELRAEIKAVEGNAQVANGRREMRREIRTAHGSRPST